MTLYNDMPYNLSSLAAEANTALSNTTKMVARSTVIKLTGQITYAECLSENLKRYAAECRVIRDSMQDNLEYGKYSDGERND